MMGSLGLTAWSCLTNQFQSGQSRHLQVGDDHIEGLRFRLGQSGIPSLSQGDFIALDLQFLFQSANNAGVVLNEQDSRFRLHLHFLQARQDNAKGRPAPEFGLILERTAMFFNNTRSDRQAQPGAGLFGGKEGSKRRS